MMSKRPCIAAASLLPLGGCAGLQTMRLAATGADGANFVSLVHDLPGRLRGHVPGHRRRFLIALWRGAPDAPLTVEERQA